MPLKARISRSWSKSPLPVTIILHVRPQARLQMAVRDAQIDESFRVLARKQILLLLGGISNLQGRPL